MRLAARHRGGGSPTSVARKAKANVQTRSRDSSLERQAEWATQLALHGELNVSRVLTPAPAAKVELPASTAMTLPAGVRTEAEAAFGADLSDVRLHNDPSSWSVAQREDARAFTAGRDIFFGEREWQPSGEEGRALLYHEIAHVLQQTGRRMSTTLIRATESSGAGALQVKGDPRHG